MIIRAIDAQGDWLFGKGLNDYKSGVDALLQNIQTRLLCFLGDCFFDTGAGIDWFNFIGNKGGQNQLALNLAISATILNTENVGGIVQLSISLASNRKLSIAYSVTTNLASGISPAATISSVVNFLITEGGSIITTEDGDRIVL